LSKGVEEQSAGMQVYL